MKTRQLQLVFGLILIFCLSGINLKGADKLEKMHQLNRDIILLNLVNGMHLTQNQKVSLINKIAEAEDFREHYQNEITKRKKEIENVLKDVREVLLKGDEISGTLKQRVHKMKKIQHSLEDEMGQNLIGLENEIKELLTPNQLMVIETYKPCTIPPATGKIGQSTEAAAENIVRLFSKIRRMSRNQYEMTKEMYVDFHLDKIEKHLGVLNTEEQEHQKQMIEYTFEKARSLSDQEFMLQKGDLANSLLPEGVKKNRRLKNQLSRAGRFLLDPAMAPILKTQLEK
jgi:hypothetical protein